MGKGLDKNENPNQGAFILDELTELVEEAVLAEFEKIAERGGVLGAMETGYQRSKIQEQSMHYEMLKHTGEYPIIGVKTLRNSHGDPVPEHIELARSIEEEKQSQLQRLADLHARHAAEAPVQLQRLQQAVIDNQNVFAVLMDAVSCCSLGQITNALFEVGGQYRAACSGAGLASRHNPGTMPTALLVIDVQQALCTGPYAAFDSLRVIDRINLVSAKARAAGAPVILIQHASTGGPLDHGSDGWHLADGLVALDTDIRLGKTATDSFHQTELQATLQRLGIDRLVICGLQSEFCVDTITRRALALGYPVTLVSDAHSTQDNSILSAAQISAHHTLTLASISNFGPRATPQAASDLAFEPVESPR